jgi:hypothetical protein
MKARSTVFAVLVGGLVVSLFSTAGAVVDTQAIDPVLKKSVLTPQDLAVIDAFVLDAVEEIVQIDDFTQSANIRAILLARTGSQTQYVQQFSESALKYISAALQQAQGIADPVKRFNVMANLLILVDSLRDPRLVDVAVRMIGQENDGVRYWAVRAATDQALWTKLNQSPATATPLAERIMAECSRVAETSSPEVINLMVEFAGRYNTAGAEDLLVHAADARIKRYAAWDARYELADAALLKLLGDRLAGGGAASPEVAKRFAQLYSFVIQRYIKGQQHNVLSDTSRNYLASVILEVEDKCLSKLLGAKQVALIRAVQGPDLDALQAEHDKLLGGEGETGTLVSKLKVNYGTPGNRPLPLPDPPAGTAAAAQP